MSNPSTEPKACIIGYPAKHSRSPMVHGFWLNEYGIAGQYDIAEVAPNDLARFISNLSNHGYVGANVTVPHKEAAFHLVDKLTATAQALGAVNTLWFENGELWGDNTDVEGFLSNLDAGAPGWDDRTDKAMVLGAGGAARAIVYGLLSRNIKSILIVNRTQTRAQDLAEYFGRSFPDQTITTASWDDMPAYLPSCDLLVNTTSLGMQGQPALTINLAALPPAALVTDAVYVPLVTPILAAAQARGLKTIGGLGMLLHQAVPGFAHWFGRKPQVNEALQAIIEADILSTCQEGSK